MPAESNIHLKVTTSADTAGLDKAVAGTKELEQATKKAVDTTGYYLDVKGRLHEESGRFVSAKGVEMKAIAEELRLQPAVSRANQELAESKRKLTAEGGKMKSGMVGNAQAMLQLSRGVQDAQYGIGGMVNNIEGLVMALGGGAGLAGALTVAFVGLDILNRNTDLFGTQSKKAKKEAEDLAQEMQKAAVAAAAEARATEAASEANRQLESRLRAVEDAYDAQTEAAKRARQEREQEARLKQIEGDASAELAMAETEDALSRGAISPEQADVRRRQITRESDARRIQTDHELKRASEAEAIAQANAARLASAQKVAEAYVLGNKGEGLLGTDARKAAEAQAKNAQAIADKQSQLVAERKADPPMVITEEWRQSIVADKERLLVMEQRVREAEAVLKRDKEARRVSGSDSPDDLQKRRQGLLDEAAQEANRADDLSRQARMSRETRERETGAFTTRQKAGEIMEGATVRQREEQERERRQQQDQQNRRARDAAEESALREAGQSTGELAEMGRAAGLNPASLAKLQQLGNKVAGGDTSTGVLNALDSLLTAFGKSAAVNAMMAGKIAKMEKELNDATAALATLREGH